LLSLWFLPADPLDGLNKPMSPSRQDFYLQQFNRFLLNTGQTTLNPQRPSISQLARFDPSKGIPEVLHSYKLLVERLTKVRECGVVSDLSDHQLYLHALAGAPQFIDPATDSRRTRGCGRSRGMQSVL
jgi:hypothetical protein